MNTFQPFVSLHSCVKYIAPTLQQKCVSMFTAVELRSPGYSERNKGVVAFKQAMENSEKFGDNEADALSASILTDFLMQDDNFHFSLRVVSQANPTSGAAIKVIGFIIVRTHKNTHRSSYLALRINP